MALKLTEVNNTEPFGGFVSERLLLIMLSLLQRLSGISVSSW